MTDTLIFYTISFAPFVFICLVSCFLAVNNAKRKFIELTAMVDSKEYKFTQKIDNIDSFYRTKNGTTLIFFKNSKKEVEVSKSYDSLKRLIGGCRD